MLVPPAAAWSLAETMAKEKEAFGFYFSGHPADAFAYVLQANNARTWTQVEGLPAPQGGGRMSVVMAGLIEEARWRTPQKEGGNRYLLLTMSDASGGYVASCFDEEAQTLIEAAVAVGEPVLLQAELLWRPGEDAPRVTIRGLTGLAELARRTRCRLTVDLASGTAASLAGLLSEARGGRGEVCARVRLPSGRIASVTLGRDFSIDTELKGRVERLRGVAGVMLGAA
jgi:DNA polymerase-3 subunit alpha